MRVVHIVPGSGGDFYCQNCMRDGALVRALGRLGHDVVLAPMYLPLFTDSAPDGRRPPVFYGAVRVYLGEKMSLVRHLPQWAARMLDAAPILRFAARRAGSTTAAGLEELTLSVLRGEDGKQARELDELVSWLAEELEPDLVHLSNALLAGLARRIRRRLRVPVVCSLQDEDVWVNAMAPEYRTQCWDLMAERAKDVSKFLAVSHYYGDTMRQRLALSDADLEVVQLGIDTTGIAPAASPPNPRVVGYLSRMCPSLGLDLLVEAFIKLKGMPGLEDVRLRATGGQVGRDAAFVEGLRARLHAAGVLGDAAFGADFERCERIRFMQSLSVLSVPVPGGEAFGAYQLEAMAAGVPVVQPRAGAFPEVIQATGGGLLCEPADPDSLAQTLAELLRDPDRARRLGRQGRRNVLAEFTIERMAERTVAAYERLTARPDS
jgi:glycosyltransferase involved in cell wall biosynthesis